MDKNLFMTYALYLEKDTYAMLKKLAQCYGKELGRNIHITTMVRRALKEFAVRELEKFELEKEDDLSDIL